MGFYKNIHNIPSIKEIQDVISNHYVCGPIIEINPVRDDIYNLHSIAINKYGISGDKDLENGIHLALKELIDVYDFLKDSSSKYSLYIKYLKDYHSTGNLSDVRIIKVLELIEYKNEISLSFNPGEIIRHLTVHETQIFNKKFGKSK